MALSLILELKSNFHVLVTNSETKEKIEVTLDFIQKVTKSSLSIIGQYKCYELIIEAEKHWSKLKRFDPEREAEVIQEAEKHWSKLKRFDPEREAEVIQEIELEDEEIKNSIRKAVIQQERKKTEAKQQHWNEIAAYNRVQKQWLDDGYKVILQSKKSLNKMLAALHYADYCLKYDYRYNSKREDVKLNLTNQTDLKDESKEQQLYIILALVKEQQQKIIALQEENQELRDRIKEPVVSASDSYAHANGNIYC